MAQIPPEYDNPRDRDQWLTGFTDSYRGRSPQSTASAYLAGHAADENLDSDVPPHWSKSVASAVRFRRPLAALAELLSVIDSSYDA